MVKTDEIGNAVFFYKMYKFDIIINSLIVVGCRLQIVKIKVGKIYLSASFKDNGWIDQFVVLIQNTSIHEDGFWLIVSYEPKSTIISAYSMCQIAGRNRWVDFGGRMPARQVSPLHTIVAGKITNYGFDNLIITDNFA